MNNFHLPTPWSHFGLLIDHPLSYPGLSQLYSTGDESPVPLPVCGTRPIVLQQHIWHLYRVISETFSEWKCIAFVKVLILLLGAPSVKRWEHGEGSPRLTVSPVLQFSLPVAQEKTDGWLAEAAQMNAALGVHSPVLQCCIRMLKEFRSYLPLLVKLGSFQRHNLSYQSLLRGRFGYNQRRGEKDE